MGEVKKIHKFRTDLENVRKTVQKIWDRHDETALPWTPVLRIDTQEFYQIIEFMDTYCVPNPNENTEEIGYNDKKTNAGGTV